MSEKKRILKDNSDNEEDMNLLKRAFISSEYVYEELCSTKIRLTCLGNFRSIEEKRKF